MPKTSQMPPPGAGKPEQSDPPLPARQPVRAYAPRGPGRLRGNLGHAAVVAGAIVVIWSAIALHLLQQRHDLAERAAADLATLSQRAGDSLADLLSDIDQAVLTLRADVPPGTSQPSHRLATAESLVIDRQGMPIQGGQSAAAAAPSLIRIHAAEPADTLHIGPPIPAAGADLVTFSRPVLAADGAPAGIAAIALRTGDLASLAGSRPTGSDATLLIGTDGVVRTRATADGVKSGQDLTGSPLFAAASAAPQGQLGAFRDTDGTERIASFQRLAPYKLIVATTRDTQAIHAAGAGSRLGYVAAGLALTFLVLLAGWFLVRQRQRLVNARDILIAAVENISQGLLMVDAQGQLPLINTRAAELLGIPDRMLARNLTAPELIRWQLENDEFPGETAEERQIRLYAKNSRFDLQAPFYERTRPDGRVLEVRTQPLPGGGAMRTYTDITRYKQSEERIRHMAYHDGLTGLANRALLQDRLTQALYPGATGGGLAVLALDLDRFKVVNDTYGHAAGDQLLTLVAARLLSTVRMSDTVARIGGDEFVIMQTGVEQPGGAADLASRIAAALVTPFDLGGHSVTVGTCIGIAIQPTDGETSEDLLKNADTAMYRAKMEGRGSFRYFEASMDLQLRERRLLERDLRRAIGTSELHLAFQPTVSCATGEIEGFEALARWTHPERGPIPPLEFIPIAEESGLIATLGAWVLEEACRCAATWAPSIHVAVNLSAVQLRNRDLPADVAATLRRTGLPPARLELEVTESLLVDDPGQAMRTLSALKAMGVQIALDDFGTGYSSFGSLRTLSFNRLKVDQSFVRTLATNATSLSIVKAILAMTRSLGLAVTAEGVETRAQLDVLRAEGCATVQGYLIGRPMPGADVPHWVADHSSRVGEAA